MKIKIEGAHQSRMLTVKSVPYSRFMNDKAKALVDAFNASGEKLKLQVYDHYRNRSLDDILEEGMYDYICSNSELVDMLYELSDAASPVGWDVEDVINDSYSGGLKEMKIRKVESAESKYEVKVIDKDKGAQHYSSHSDLRAAMSDAVGMDVDTMLKSGKYERVTVASINGVIFELDKHGIVASDKAMATASEQRIIRDFLDEEEPETKRVSIAFDIEVPVTWSEEGTENRILKALKENGITVDGYMEVHTID